MLIIVTMMLMTVTIISIRQVSKSLITNVPIIAKTDNISEFLMIAGKTAGF